MRRYVPLVVLALAVALVSCSESESPSPTPPTPLLAAGFALTAQILGPVQNDDESDLEVTVRETNGVSASLNFARLTCSNGAAFEWGADDFPDNRVPARASYVFTHHYNCPSSSRPRELLVDLTDDSGYHHQVTAAPFHPDWPGA